MVLEFTKRTGIDQSAKLLQQIKDDFLVLPYLKTKQNYSSNIIQKTIKHNNEEYMQNSIHINNRHFSFALLLSVSSKRMSSDLVHLLVSFLCLSVVTADIEYGVTEWNRFTFKTNGKFLNNFYIIE